MKYFTELEIMDDFNARVDKLGQREVARQLGFTPAFINDVLHARRPLTLKLANSLGYIQMPDRYTKGDRNA